MPVVISQYYGLDFSALSSMAPAFGLLLSQNFFEKLRLFERECLRIWEGEQPGKCSKAKKAECAYKFGKHLEWTCKRCDKK